MLRYVIARLFGALPTLFVILTVAFFMIRLAPGGPFDRDRPMDPQVKANIEKSYHLDEPLVMQYGRYVGGILTGDFGPSFKYRDYTVTELISQGFPYSLTLGVTAMALALILGGAAGIIAALRQNSRVDVVVMGIAMTGITIPNFVVAPVMVLVFAVTLRLLPAGGTTAGWTSYVLPVIALALPPAASIARLTRGSMIEVLRANYIRTARAKGMPDWIVLVRHALKPGLLPVVSYLGPAIANIITGSVVIEQIFGLPGIGRYFIQGALNRDYLLVMGIVVFYGSLIIFLNLLVDLAYGFLDPRVRYD